MTPDKMSEDAILNDLEAAEKETSSTEVSTLIKELNKSVHRNNTDVWQRMARLSVIQRDVSSSLFCITRLRMARVARDVKHCLSRGKTLALAVTAINLNLVEEAEKILEEQDLVKFYQQINEWDKAMNFSDGLNVKNVYYDYAKYLESRGEIEEAIKYYEKSKTHVFQVTRMLFQLDDGKRALFKYCMEGEKLDQDKLIRWWGQFCESQGNFQDALIAYEKAKDHQNIIRLLCFTGNINKAKDMAVALMSSDSNQARHALIFLAKELEDTDPTQAIQYYLSCKAYQQATRVCRTHSLWNELAKITADYGSENHCRQMIQEISDQELQDILPEVLVKLHHRINDTNTAIEVAVRHRTWKQLRDLVKEFMEKDRNVDLNEETMLLVLDALRDDAEIIDVTLDLLLLTEGDRVNDTIEKLLLEFNVDINEELVEKVNKLSKHSTHNSSLSKLLTDLSLRQGKYLLAAKIFNSHGDRVNSLKALIRSGQTDKVINYANIARDKQVYRIAGNFLQQVNHQDRGLIQTFYKKAGARDELDRFTRGNKSDV